MSDPSPLIPEPPRHSVLSRLELVLACATAMMRDTHDPKAAVSPILAQAGVDPEEEVLILRAARLMVGFGHAVTKRAQRR